MAVYTELSASLIFNLGTQVIILFSQDSGGGYLRTSVGWKSMPFTRSLRALYYR